MKAIIRFSLDAKKATATTPKTSSSPTRIECDAILTNAGFKNVGTATWEVAGQTEAIIKTAVRDVFDAIAASPDADLDHIWVYVAKE